MKRACVMIVGLGVMLGGGSVFAQDKPAAAATDLPGLEALQTKMVKAVGGAEALAKIQTLHTVMTMNMMGQDIEMDSAWSRKGGRTRSPCMCAAPSTTA